MKIIKLFENNPELKVTILQIVIFVIIAALMLVFVVAISIIIYYKREYGVFKTKQYINPSREYIKYVLVRHEFKEVTMNKNKKQENDDEADKYFLLNYGYKASEVESQHEKHIYKLNKTEITWIKFPVEDWAQDYFDYLYHTVIGMNILGYSEYDEYKTMMDYRVASNDKSVIIRVINNTLFSCIIDSKDYNTVYECIQQLTEKDKILKIEDTKVYNKNKR